MQGLLIAPAPAVALNQDKDLDWTWTWNLDLSTRTCTCAAQRRRQNPANGTLSLAEISNWPYRSTWEAVVARQGLLTAAPSARQWVL
ncbi:hypothetical protein CGMCC3_g6945 [Colletotrichum fructicola]|nr:uncharacterized protein CGMCC3_g6945 [Colletotrichum fructicola]KAE9577230.1 hypothetical protein CGMCC3_g6945 [Colletotrichum fructicola]